MKKFLCIMIAIALVMAFFTSCTGNETGIERTTSKDIVIESSLGVDKKIEFYDMDSCQYIGSLRGQNNDWAAHRGQCKYCRKRRIEEMKEAIKEYFEGR